MAEAEAARCRAHHAQGQYRPSGTDAHHVGEVSLVVHQRGGTAEHSLLGALPDDVVLLPRLGDLHLGPAAFPGEVAGEIDGFELGALAAQERPLGFAIEVDPPLGAGINDDENGGGHTQYSLVAAAVEYTFSNVKGSVFVFNMFKRQSPV